MAYTTIDDPSAYFQTALYTGNGGTLNIVNDGNLDLQPDWVWLKDRDAANYHALFDTNRGANIVLHSNDTLAEITRTNALTSFNTDGFSLGANGNENTSSNGYVAWQWKANGGTTSSNSDGSITSTVQANTTAGFSIVTYTGNATAGATIGHGLGVIPNWIIVKDRDAAKNWVNYHQSLGNDRSITLNTTDAQSASTDHWNNNTPTSSVFYLGDYSHVNATDNFVAYCFAEKQGYSKFGSYTGNGSEDGPFVYTGFKPAWIMFKNTGAAEEWVLYDTKRDSTNPNTKTIRVDSNIAEAEATTLDIDFLSNGFKNRSNQAQLNSDGVSYIYMAFAEHPFVGSDGVPTTAR